MNSQMQESLKTETKEGLNLTEQSPKPFDGFVKQNLTHTSRWLTEGQTVALQNKNSRW